MHQGIVLCFIVLVAVSNIQKTFCLFEASVTYMELIFKNNTEYVDLSNLLMKKVNRTNRLIMGSFETFIDFNNDYEMLATLNKKSGNEFRRLPYKIGKPFCTFYDEGTMFMPEVRKVSNLPAKGICPWVTNVYKIDGYRVNLDNTPKILEAGEYMAEIQLLKKGIVLNGIRVFGIIDYV